MSYSTDGTFLAVVTGAPSGGGEHELKVYRTETLTTARADQNDAPGLFKEYKLPGEVAHVGWSNGGASNHLAVAFVARETPIQVYNEKLEPLAVDEQCKAVQCFDWHPDGSAKLLCGTSDGEFLVLDASSGSIVKQ